MKSFLLVGISLFSLFSSLAQEKPLLATESQASAAAAAAAVAATVNSSGATLSVGQETALSSDEVLNVRIYRQSSAAVANILTKATEYDFWMDPVPVEGAGSGFVIDAKGYILTNFHVVDGAQTIEVVLGDQSHHPAKFIGADQRNDVALIKIEPGQKPLAVLPLGDSSALEVGQKVLAIGNPFGFQSTLTTGVVSALGRTVQTGQNTLIDEAIQTDAAINRGNSGGPLINTHGEVIGINSAIYTPSGTTAGIGFAIPINTAKRIAHDLITDGRVHQAFLGLEAIPLNESFAEALGLSTHEGLLVQTTTRGGPAAEAGIHGGDRIAQAGLTRFYIGGDVIVEVDGRKLTSPLDLSVFLNKKRPGDTVSIALFRGGNKMTVSVKLGERTGDSIVQSSSNSMLGDRRHLHGYNANQLEQIVKHGESACFHS